MVPLKLVPETEAAETVMVAVVVPTTMVVDGVGEARVNCAVPVPERATAWGLPVALSETLSVPLSPPVAAGAKVTLTVQLCPGLSTLSKALHVSVSWKLLLALIPVMVNVEVPVLVMVAV